MKLSALTVTPANERGVLVLEGVLDVHTAPVLQEAIDQAPATEPLVLDMAGLEFVDSSGLRVLVAAHNARSTEDAPLRLRNVDGEPARLLQITDLDTVFLIEPPAQ
jgi:anti-sigma B factor antagonist